MDRIPGVVGTLGVAEPVPGVLLAAKSVLKDSLTPSILTSASSWASLPISASNVGRAAGEYAMHCLASCTRAAGAVSGHGSASVLVVMPSISCAWRVPSYGSLAVYICHSMTPNDHTSEAGVSRLSLKRSGAMNTSVPQGPSVTCPATGQYCASPKSDTLATKPLLSLRLFMSSTLAGFRSPWMTLAQCRWNMPCAISREVRYSARSATLEPNLPEGRKMPREMAVSSEPWSQYSMIICVMCWPGLAPMICSMSRTSPMAEGRPSGSPNPSSDW
mmetsp:Transcript_3782/g.9449  ORF Transcript_3782/g.9449 Transcript_3782/m.9449 type:complete len:274 (-) Transcript_3782:945-1766(-)